MRSRSRAALGALLLAVLPFAVSRAQNPTPPEFGQGIELVSVDVLVLDKQGNPVTGRTRDDFKVTDNDQPQSIASFEAIQVAESQPSRAPVDSVVSTNAVPPPRPERSIVVIVDDIHLTQTGLRRTQAELA